MIKLLLNNFRIILALLPKRKRVEAYLIGLLLLIGSISDLIGLGALIPVFVIVLKPDAIKQSEVLSGLKSDFGISSELNFVLLICLAVFILVLVKNFIALLIQYRISQFATSIQEYFSNRLFEKYLFRGLTFIKNSNSNRIARDVNSVPLKFSTNLLLPLLNLTNELIIITFILIGLTIYNPWVVLMVVLIVLPTFSLFYRFSKDKVQFYAEKIFEISPRITKTLYETFFGYIDIKVSGTDKKFRSEYRDHLNESVHYQVLNQTFKVAPQKVVETSTVLGVLVLIGFGLYYYEEREALLMLLSIFALAAYRILPSANRLMVALVEIRAHQYTLEVLDRVNISYPEETQEEVPITFERQLGFDGVSFAYDNAEDRVLKDFNLTITKGERVGIVGKSGSGKSTIMNLLLLFFAPDQGSIYCDDKKLTLASQVMWRRLIGYVPQEVFLNDGDVRTNVAFGIADDEIDDQLVLKCLERARLKEVVDQLPDGIYNSIGERGTLLSGGQRQRIGIARALYFGAEILLFDEATSALDSETERAITDSIHHLAKEDITMLTIAHRISSLKHCSRIIELDHGNVVGEHTYDELIKTQY